MPPRQCLVGRALVQSTVWLLLLTLALLPATSRASIAWETQSDFTPSPGVPEFTLNTTLRQDSCLHLYPLTRSPHHVLKGNTTGTLVSVGLDNANKVTRSDIAFISCDASAYSVPSDIDVIVETAVSSGPPVALLFYTTTDSKRCTYRPGRGSQDLAATFSLADTEAARDIRDTLKNSSSSSPSLETSTIIIHASMAGGEDVGAPQNTAMIILYTVTGIITVLFLGVIITGTVRAHLNPDRYGPRQDSNGQRQSRARGIARAVVETLPIVKFGDQEDKQPPKSDVEMASNDGEDRDSSTDDSSARSERQTEAVNTSSAPTPTAAATTTTAAAAATAPSNETRGGSDDDIQMEEEKGKDQQDLIVAGNASGPSQASDTNIGPSSPTVENTAAKTETSDAGTLVCPICTDDFIKGQDVRLLPCKHKFHPECVDPWLLNVSGTCPLCRIDLSPKGPEDDDVQSLWPTLTHQSTGQNNIRHTVMEERLREVRGLQIPENGEAEAEAEAEAGEIRRRNRLSQRIVDKLRIRTARHGEEFFP